MVREFLWDGKRPRINIKKMRTSRDTGGLGLPNVKLYNLAFEMSRLSEHWRRQDNELSWISIEKEMAGCFTPLDILSHGPKTNGHGYSSNPVLVHSKSVWREAHKLCGYHTQDNHMHIYIIIYTDIRIGKRSVYWDQWHVQGIYKISDLYSEGRFMTFSDLVYKSITWCIRVISGNICKSEIVSPKANLLRVETQ